MKHDLARVCAKEFGREADRGTGIGYKTTRCGVVQRSVARIGVACEGAEQHAGNASDARHASDATAVRLDAIRTARGAKKENAGRGFAPGRPPHLEVGGLHRNPFARPAAIERGDQDPKIPEGAAVRPCVKSKRGI